MSGLSRLLEPHSIAVVGANDRPDSYGDTMLRNLERLGFDGHVWGVNPNRERVRDVKCFPTIEDLPSPVDALAVAIPAAGVPGVLRSAGRTGCGGAVVVSAGFGEVESGRGLEQELREAAAESGMPVCGPNGNGIVNFAARAALWGDSVQPLQAGAVGLISQSGNVAVNALGSHRAIGFHTVVSTGNQAVLDASDWLAALCERDGIRSIGLFLESDGDGPRLAEALACCAEREIRVAVLKVGSSAAGAGAAAAHTGALAGDQRVFRSLIEDAGAAWARDPHELLELSRVLAEPRARPRGDGGLAVLTCSGGDSGIAADEAERLGIELPPLGEATRDRLRELLPDAATVGNPLDYTSLIWAETERLRDIVATTGDDPAIDQLLIFHDTPQDLSDEAVESWKLTRDGLAAGGRQSAAAPLFSSTLPDLISEEIIHELAAEGTASVCGLATAMVCALGLRARSVGAERLRAIAAAAELVPHDPEPGPPRAEGVGAWLGELRSKELLQGAGIPTPEGRSVADAGECLTAAMELGWPVALKLSAPSIQHKSEIGAMQLGITEMPALLTAFERISRLPEADAGGAAILIERMSDPGVELLLAARSDAVVPALVVGLGGVWTEALDDVAVIPLPASPERVAEALLGLRGSALLTGARGGPPVDLDAIAAAASRCGNLLIDERLELVEVNPLIAGPDGCVAVDAVVKRGGARAG